MQPTPFPFNGVTLTSVLFFLGLYNPLGQIAYAKLLAYKNCFRGSQQATRPEGDLNVGCGNLK